MVTGLEPVTHFALRRRWGASYWASSSSIQSGSISKDFLGSVCGVSWLCRLEGSCRSCPCSTVNTGALSSSQ